MKKVNVQQLILIFVLIIALIISNAGLLLRDNCLKTQIQTLTNQVEGLSNLQNKKILIIGDSLSDEALYPNCWVKKFRILCNNVGADVTNYSLQGRSIGRYTGATNYLMNVLSGIPAGTYDKIIVFLGTNDWLNQVELGSSQSASQDSLIQNMNLFSDWVEVNQPNTEVTFITPPKSTVADDLRHKLLQFYAMAIASTAHWLGFQVIDVHNNAPILSSGNITDWTIDGIHFIDDYAPHLAQYIFNQMLSSSSDTGLSNIKTRLGIGDVEGNATRVFAFVSGDGSISYQITSFTISGVGNIKLADLPEEVSTSAPVYGCASCSYEGRVFPILLLSTGTALYACLEEPITDGVIEGSFNSGFVPYVSRASISY